jgi:hypothetical protein
VTDDPDAPPGGWPPVSVVGAAVLIALPPVAVAGFALATGPWWYATVPLVWLAILLVPLQHLLGGEPAAYGGIVGATLLTAVLVVGTAGVAYLEGARPRHLSAWLPAVVYLLTVATCLWWPETRRWCGLLPPAGRDDD